MRRLSEAINAFLKTRWFYPLVFVGAATPLVLLLWGMAPLFLPLLWPDVQVPWESDLGVNPVETLIHETGQDALGLLLVSLAITPIRRLFGWNRVQLVRRMLGIWSFVYALAHLSMYVAFDKLGSLRDIADDVLKRPFIFVGMFAFTILLVLALTSTNGMMRRLGRNWQRLHRLVYAGAVAGVVHFTWGQKADLTEPLRWAFVLTLLLGLRLFYAVRKASARPQTAISR